MSDDVKDFAYYAERAEEQLQHSMGRDADGQPAMIGEGAKNRHVMRADVYARLACGAPKPEPVSDWPMRDND